MKKSVSFTSPLLDIVIDAIKHDTAKQIEIKTGVKATTAWRVKNKINNSVSLATIEAIMTGYNLTWHSVAWELTKPSNQKA